MMAKRRPQSANRPPPADNQNRLLASLPVEEYRRIVQSLDVVPLKLKNIIHRAGEPIEYVYFPGSGFCSILTVLKDGAMVEVATIGREGMVGVTAALDGNPVSSTSMVQGESDTCYRMKADAFRREMERRGVFYEITNALRAGARRVHHAIHRVQRGSLRRATIGALAADGARPNGFG